MKNVGTVDQWIRIIAGVVLLSLLFIVEGNAKYIGLLGLIPLFTGLFRTCPAYSLLGISTNKK